MMKKRIDVTIVTGFLGSGKTTLLNHMIDRFPEKKFAIIENEFGEIGIDNELVIGAEEGIFEMSNGCICCVLNDELVETLNKMLQSSYQFDHLIIETTGIADPGAVAAVFIGHEAIQRRFRLDGTICVADAQFLEDNLKEKEAVDQLTFADLILLNKADSVQENYLNQLKSIIKGINPYTDVITTNFSDFKEKNILAINAYDAEKIEEKTSFIPHHHHHHHEGITSHSFSIEGVIDPLKLEMWLAVLLQLQGHAIFRIKGIFKFPNENRKVIFQSVRTQSSITLGSPWIPEEKVSNRMVFIGKDLKREPLEKKLKSCLLKENIV